MTGSAPWRQDKARGLSLQLGESHDGSWFWGRMAGPHVGQDLFLATRAATSPYSRNVAIYTLSLCLHLISVISLESDLTCFQNTSSSPEPGLIRAVHPVPGLGPGTRDFSEVPSQSGQGCLGQNLFSQERRTILQPLTSA